jgi:hypothetical protein
VKIFPIFLILFIACSNVPISEFSVSKNLDDYTLCFPESAQLFNKLSGENKIRVYRLILEERNNRTLDCGKRFSDLMSAEQYLDDFNNEELLRKSFPCDRSNSSDTCLAPL